MACKQSLYMNQGEGEASYARNSSIQSAVQKWMKPCVEEAATDLMRKFSNTSRSMVIADLGCSSGPNAVALASMAVDAIFRHRGVDGQVLPELCVLLNDLPDNDFNSVANHLDAFQKAPEDLRKNGIPMYDCDEGLRQARRPLVLEAYARQFRKDFTLFLNLRTQELIPGGQMVISLPGHSTCQSNLIWDATAFMLNDMVSRGVIDREKLDSFHIPMYAPSEKELREIIQDESSFIINKILARDVLSAMDKSSITPKMLVLATRAAHEPMILQHFGPQGQVVEEFERTVEWHVSAGSTQVAAPGIVTLCVSLEKKI